MAKPKAKGSNYALPKGWEYAGSLFDQKDVKQPVVVRPLVPVSPLRAERERLHDCGD